MNRIRDLIDELHKHDNLYNNGKPIISDKEYDNLYFELQELENETDIIYPDSPTQSIKYKVVNNLTKVEHNHLLLSLDKTKSIEDLEKFIDNKHYTIMAKMDGLTISIRYINGELVSAETRGDGHIGENILHNARFIKNLPQRISYKDELIIDGEAIITYDDFRQFENEYANPRNLVAGSIRLLDSAESKKRNISFIAWKVYKGFDDKEWYSKKLDELDKLGFTTVPRLVDSNTITIEGIIEQIKRNCEFLNYPIDGCVIGIDNIKEAAAMGEATSHHEKFQIAYKFYNEEYETTLKDIEWSMGRTGQLTPVAIFKPVNTGDSTNEKASLHNLSVMEETLGKYPYEGQSIWMIKSNEIIPQISKAEKNDIEENGFDLIGLYIPNICPICGKPTEIRDDGVAKVLYCGNPHCQGKLINIIKHYADIDKGVGIRGLSEKTIEFLMDKGWLENIKDLYTIDKHKEEWINCKGWGELSVNKIIAAIETSKTVPLDKFISALGIREVGRTAAKDIARYFKTWSDFRNAQRLDFLSIDNIGAITADELLNFDYSFADFIVENYIDVLSIEEKIEETNKPLEGLSFCITGKIKHGKRKDVEQDIIDAGGKAVSSVSSKLSYLVNNYINSTSSKNVKAKELNIPIIDEDALYAMINNI